MFFGHTDFLKLVSGWFSDTRNPPMVGGVEGGKIINYTMHLGNICVSWKDFVSKFL